MAIVRIAAQDAKATAAAASVTATYLSTPTRFNLLVATVHYNAGGGPSVMTGWFNVADIKVGDSSVIGMAMWIKIAGASEATNVVATATGATTMKLHIYEYSGNEPSLAAVLETFNTSLGPASNVTTKTTGSITTVNPNDLLFAMVGVSGTITVPSWDSSFGLRQSDASIRIFDGDRIAAGAGSFNPAGSWTTAVRASGIIAAFKPLGSLPASGRAARNVLLRR